jgi:hypothetical protein
MFKLFWLRGFCVGVTADYEEVNDVVINDVRLYFGIVTLQIVWLS